MTSSSTLLLQREEVTFDMVELIGNLALGFQAWGCLIYGETFLVHNYHLFNKKEIHFLPIRKGTIRK